MSGSFFRPRIINLSTNLHRLAAACLVVVLGYSVAHSETTVAAIVPLTGNGADQGEWARRGIEIAQEHLRKAGQDDIRVIYEDSKGGDPATAVRAYRSMYLNNKGPAVVTWGSGVGIALTPLTNSDRVIQMGFATATPKYRTEGDYSFRNFPSATTEAKFLAEALIDKLGAKEIAILNINNDYGVGTSGATEEAFLARGGKIAFHESFNPGEVDFRSMLLKLRRNPELFVYLAVYPTDGALLLKQAREIGLSNRFIASIAIMGGREFFSLAADAANGLLVVSTAGNSTSKFAVDYASKYGSESPGQEIYSARAYDSIMLVAEALRNCGTKGADCLRDYLSGIRNYAGASATLSFDSAGDIETSFSLFRVQNRKFELVSEVR